MVNGILEIIQAIIFLTVSCNDSSREIEMFVLFESWSVAIML